MNTLKKGILEVNSQDLRVWELVTMVPQVSNIWAYVCLVLNILVPGTGTMLVACLGDANINKTQLGIGVAQLLTSVYLVGWFISIYWGYLIVKRSRGDHNEIKQLIGSANANSQGAPNSADPSIGRRSNKRNNPFEDQ